ncbi:hypothetical protein SAMN05216462_1754 [Xylanibacter ruminicola]|uniref:Uncharacterized protein n=1 Tax=Xylanibacter ruminicola TaxID=839 RepID=A0A1H4C4J5_XYLRU|nr:hypothetical protein [Xylanibacter ruminicola]SEA55012.1 hypothetical protein SAMN05216462_1754 [Xylanibacter ruminicola]
MDKAKVNKWLSYLNTQNTNKKGVLSGMLDECTFDELELIYHRSRSLYHGLLSLSYLRRKNYSEIYSSSIQPHRPIKEYVGLQAYVIKRNADLINQYVELKYQADCAVLRGDYVQARTFIEKINKTVSYSYWAACYLIKIERLDKGLQACSNLYNRLFSENHTIVQSLIYCAFRSSSLDFLLEDVKRVLWPKSAADSELVNNYLISHSMPYLGFKEGIWMCTDMNSSIIDLYNNLINFLPNLEDATLNDESVRHCLSELNACIKDKYLNKLCYLFKIGTNLVVDNERQTILNDYLQADYASVQEKAKPYFERNADDFEVYSLYLKSLLHCGGTIEQPSNESDITKKIGYHYFEILSHKNNQSFHKRRLQNICRSQYHIQGVRYMLSLLDGIETDDIYSLYDTSWKCLPYHSPVDACMFEEQDDRKAYIRTLSRGTDVWEQLFNEHPVNLTDDYMELSIAGIDRDTAYPFLEKRFNNNDVPPYMKDAVASFIFNHLIRLEHYQEAIRFYVESRLHDAALVIGFENKDTIIGILENKDIAREIPLELSIFAEMVGADAESMYFIYKKYLKTCGVQRASEIEITGDEKQRYFLENVAVVKVLTLHVLRFKSVKQVMEERSAICSNLYDYYQDKKINEEISSICRDIKIMDLNNQVDESKIYVDVRSIKDNELKEARDLYDMFDNTSNQVAYHDIVMSEIYNLFNSHGLPTNFSEIDETGKLRDASGKVEMVNYRKDVMTQLFLAIRNQFLFNPKFGLDNYLSTRIRHGTLVNQLRNHFEERNLVTNTINGNYAHNDFWVGSQFELRDSRTLQCLQLFESFSKCTDAIISDIKDSYVQVKTEDHKEKEKGCFDFDKRFFDGVIDMLLMNQTLNSFDACYDLIIEYLWKHTERCLETMREKLVEVQTEMLNNLHTLQRDVLNVIGSDNPGVNLFNDAVSYCQNGIQNDFQIVTKWFKRSNYVDFDFTIGQVIDTSIGFINRNNKNILKTRVTDNSATTFQGRYFGTLYDIFHDILNNALVYEKKYRLNGECEIKVAENEGYLQIQVSNPIREEDEASLIAKIQEISSKLEEKIYTGKTRDEGNTGCSKIYNAVYYHLGSSQNTYGNAVEDQHFVVNVDIEINPIKR